MFYYTVFSLHVFDVGRTQNSHTQNAAGCFGFNQQPDLPVEICHQSTSIAFATENKFKTFVQIELF